MICRERMQEWADRTMIVLFAIAISLPLMKSCFPSDGEGELQEKRERAPFPSLSWDLETLAQFPARFEAFYNDAFGFRDQLVHWHHWLKLYALGDSPNTQVLQGKEGWFYLGNEALTSYRADSPFTEDELRQWTLALEERRAWLEVQGIHYLIVIVPDAHTVYPEHLPGWVQQKGRQSRLDQLLEYARTHTELTLVDLRKPLSEAKTQERLYHRTDTHWNEAGALVGAQCIAAHLTSWFPRIEPSPASAFTREIQKSPGGDLACMMGLQGSMDEETLRVLPRQHRLAYSVPPPSSGFWSAERLQKREISFSEVPDARLPSAVIWHDSFMVSLRPFLLEHFSRSVCLWEDCFDPDIVRAEKPDLVIHEFAARRLMSAMPTNPPLVKRILPEQRLARQFEGSTDVLLRVSAHQASGIESLNQIQFIPDSKGIRLRCHGTDPQMILPKFSHVVKHPLAVRIEMTSPVETELELFYQTSNAATYAQERRIARCIPKGRSIVFLTLDAPDLAGRLRFDPGMAPGDYLLHHLEIRAIPSAAQP